MQVLIVEDDEVVQGVLKAYLTHYAGEHGMDLELQQLDDASEALALFTDGQHDSDMVFLDVRMPKMSGDELYSQLQKIRPELLGRIIFITSHRAGLLERFPDQKLNILDKPFRYQRLLEAMDAISV